MTVELGLTDPEGILEALRASELSYRRLFETAQDGILILDSATGRVTDVNPFLVKLLGFSHDDMIGRTVGDLSPFKDLVSNQKMLEKLQKVGYVRYENLPLETSDGRKIAVEFVCNVYQAGSHQVIQCNIRDITARKQMEKEKAKLQTQLLQAQKMASLGTLAGGVAHDMNNVLGAILGLASAHIGTQPYGSPLHKALDTICKATERGGKMVKNLLSFAHQSPVENCKLDMNGILKDQVALLERTTLAKVRLQVDLEPELRPILGDASALTHAFINLCVNAVDAMPENGTLTLYTRNVDNDWIEVMVEDDGMGMPKEVLEKAMEPFFTTKETGKGTGLGLSTVFSTVRAHRGQMAIESEPDKGTRIRLRFPACEKDAYVVPPSVSEITLPPNGTLKVLVVDDDGLIQSSFQAILEGLGHTAVTALSGEEALDLLGAGLETDLVILDMNMPGLGGIGTLPRLRVLRPEVPVLLVTGRIDQSALTLASAHPGVTLLSKPFGLRELQKHLENMGLG
jgi:PAS domain S-box-containing protein